jgi:hypothetical protein
MPDEDAYRPIVEEGNGSGADVGTEAEMKSTCVGVPMAVEVGRIW